ncbi:MAG: NAD(P)H-hydrate dehydratase [Deltaproteobacteria bacterium]|nr:NAD(P)H-hydrate dehydratase [Deltaproteobacteria bacterium]
MRIVTNDEMRAIDEAAIEKLGIPSQVLMENAGLEAARVISQRVVDLKHLGEILVFCGKGKNGGDGLVVARRLLASGHRVRVFLLHDVSEYSGESAVNLAILKNMRAKVSFVETHSVVEEYFKSATPPFFAVDAILGTGIKRDVEGTYYDVIELINQHAGEIVALDIPSGVVGDSGRVAGTSVQATTTVSFGYPKLGHFLSPGAARRGKLYNVDLSFPRSWAKEGDKHLLTLDTTAPLLQGRDRFGHKNSFGHSLLIGGSPGRIGAIVMASNSCLKMGTGLVTVASWEDSFPSLEIKLSAEIMNFRVVREGNEFPMPKPGLSAFSSIVVGPGLGMRDDGGEMMKQLIVNYGGPLVIDADGLNLIAEYKLHQLIAKRTAPTILTPHPGEMARLLDVSKDTVVDDPLKSAHEAFERTGAIVILKGPTTLIHSNDNITWFNHYPNDGMATAGTGDILAGMIGGLVGQRMNALDAARLGVFLHSLAGKCAADQSGHRAMTATDITASIRDAFRLLREHQRRQISHACVELY